MRGKLKYVFFFLAVVNHFYAQHYQFSQFYAAQPYLNPAFTGANVCGRLSMNYRNQWSGIPGTFTSYLVAADHYAKKLKSGIGIMVFSDKAGTGSLRSTQFNLLYAYQLTISKKVGARFGCAVGGVQRSIDYSFLTFGDQIARGGASTSVEDLSAIRALYFDMNLGGLVFTKNDWLGVSVSHVTSPNQSLINETSKLPRELMVHGGHKFVLEEGGTGKDKSENSVTIAYNYKHQNAFNQLDLGLYYSKNYVVAGIWYRGVPFYKPYSWYQSRDALVFLLGVSVDKLKIGYSYDYTISKLTNMSSNGTHEISMGYQFCNFKSKKKKKPILISCPKF